MVVVSLLPPARLVLSFGRAGSGFYDVGLPDAGAHLE
jgi:hypothetical protein